MGKTSLAVTKYCVPLWQFSEGDIGASLGGGGGHGAMIPPLICILDDIVLLTGRDGSSLAERSFDRPEFDRGRIESFHDQPDCQNHFLHSHGKNQNHLGG